MTAIDKDAVAQRELQRLYKRDQVVTTESVVAEARDASNPLHDRFEWDDTIAAHQHRLATAAQIIRSVTIKVETVEDKVIRTRAWVSVTELDGSEKDDATVGSYIPVDIVVATPVLREKYQQAMEREWRQMLRKYQDVKEFIDMVISDIESLRQTG